MRVNRTPEDQAIIHRQADRLRRWTQVRYPNGSPIHIIPAVIKAGADYVESSQPERLDEALHHHIAQRIAMAIRQGRLK